MHGDLKPDNILVSMVSGHGVHIKLCDFDSARILPVDENIPCNFACNVEGMLKFTRGNVII